MRLTPKSSADAVVGVADGPDGPHIAAKVRALPVEGAANTALETLIARWLGLPKRDVSVAGGGKSRMKSIELAGDPVPLAALVDGKLASLTES